MTAQMNRRIYGMLAKRLDEAALGDVTDGRDARGQRWPLAVLLRAVVGGMVAGKKSRPAAASGGAAPARPNPPPSPIPRPQPIPAPSAGSSPARSPIEGGLLTPAVV